MSRAAARRPLLYKKHRGAGELGEIAIDRAAVGGAVRQSICLSLTMTIIKYEVSSGTKLKKRKSWATPVDLL
jgi:hypothetical protein